jgi:hypothetical protein
LFSTEIWQLVDHGNHLTPVGCMPNGTRTGHNVRHSLDSK